MLFLKDRILGTSSAYLVTDAKPITRRELTQRSQTSQSSVAHDVMIATIPKRGSAPCS
jgi:hypothetical protein